MRRSLTSISKLISITFGLLTATSSSFGALAGSIQCGGVSAPTRSLGISGPNWRTYCPACVLAGRTFGRVEVIDTLEASAKAMQTLLPETRIVFGEIGWPNGGIFRPHRTHRQGVSVDIMVPMKNGKEISTSVLNRYGYDVEFDSRGRNKNGEIDFDALVALLKSLEKQASKRGGSVKRVFFAPDLQPLLFSARGGRQLRRSMRFNKRQSWVRHDDHIHVDFTFPCPAKG